MILPDDPEATKFVLALFADLAQRHAVVPTDPVALCGDLRHQDGWVLQRGQHVAHIWMQGIYIYVTFYQWEIDPRLGPYIERTLPFSSSGPFLLNGREAAGQQNITRLRNFFTRPLQLRSTTP